MTLRRAIPLVALLAIPVQGAAQQSTDGAYVLHEYFDSLTLPSNGTDGGAGPAQTPSQPVPVPGQPPALSLEARDGEPIYSKDGPVFEREIGAPYGELSPYAGANRLDDRTDRVDSLTYFSSFEPSVIPYKRVVAQNFAVRHPDGEYSLEVKTGPRSAVEIAAVDAESDVFWGTFLIHFESDRLHPIASVSPDQKLLQVVTEPDVALDIEVDDAGNFLARSSQPGLVRVNLQIAVPKFYFGGALPAVDWSDLQGDLMPPMDAATASHARRIATELGFDRSKPPRETLLSMVRYFRNFDARPFPDELKSGDRLSAIAKNAIGVCRHRSLAFVFLAQALGIPTRYVYNEAHAFVEVHWPGHGWRRIDLGGAANELSASAQEGRGVHDPGDDGLPTPERFLEEQQHMASTGWDPPGGSGEGENGNGRSGQTNGEHGENAENGGGPGEHVENAENRAESGDPDHGAGFEEMFGGTNGGGTEPAEDLRASSRLQIVQATAVVQRGGQVRLEAVLTDGANRALTGRDVDIYLGPVGSTQRAGARQIGSATTGANGRLRTTVTVPREHAIGRWSLFLYFPGDEQYRPVVAE